MSELLTFAECVVLAQKGEISAWRDFGIKWWLGKGGGLRYCDMVNSDEGGPAHDAKHNEIGIYLVNHRARWTPIREPRQIVIESVDIRGWDIGGDYDTSCLVLSGLSAEQQDALMKATRLVVET